MGVSMDAIQRPSPEPENKESRCVLVFVKYPEPGRVKTRLAAHTGPKAAAELYKSFILETLSIVENLNADIRICYTPADAGKRLTRWLGAHRRYIAQSGSDLGHRMKNAFDAAFDEGFTDIIVIGSDSPDLPADYLNQAFSLLQADRIVLGPSSDGGYYLLGFNERNYLPAVFDLEHWSTDDVCSRTVEIIEKHKKPVNLLPIWHDIDTPADLEALKRRNAKTLEQHLNTSFIVGAHERAGG